MKHIADQKFSVITDQNARHLGDVPVSPAFVFVRGLLDVFRGRKNKEWVRWRAEEKRRRVEEGEERNGMEEDKDEDEDVWVDLESFERYEGAQGSDHAREAQRGF